MMLNSINKAISSYSQARISKLYLDKIVREAFAESVLASSTWSVEVDVGNNHGDAPGATIFLDYHARP